MFYAHTLSPIAIAALFTVALCLYIGSFHWALGLLALAAYAVVGVAVPLVTSRLSGDDGLRFRQRSGELSSFVLDSLRGLLETLQYGQGQRRLEEMDARTAALSQDEARMKRTAGRNQAVTNTVILVFDVAMLFAAVGLYQAAGGLSGGTAAHAGADELLWTLCGAGQPGKHLAEHLRRGEPGAGHFGGGAGGGGNPGQGRPLLYRGAAEQVSFAYGEERILDASPWRCPRAAWWALWAAAAAGNPPYSSCSCGFGRPSKGRCASPAGT